MDLFLNHIAVKDSGVENDPFARPLNPALDRPGRQKHRRPDEQLATSAAAEENLHEQLSDDILGRLNGPQRQAVEQTDGPLLILAGAGSGKTRVIIHRIAWLLRVKQVAPWQIMAVTFTNKAAREMRERLYGLIGPLAEKVVLSTFHSLGLRLLRYEQQHLELSSNFTVYDSSDQDNLIKKVLKELKIDPKKNRPGQFAHHINQAKDRLQSPAQYEESLRAEAVTPFEENLIRVYHLYEERKLKNNALDFADLIYRAVLLLQTNEEVRQKYQSRWQYLMVDEYQDTNYAQYVMCRLLSEQHGNIAVVGDDDQSIYSWRGAEIRNILDFEKDYPACLQIKLEQNYRSHAKILAAANSVIRNNGRRKDKTLWTSREEGSPVRLEYVYDETEEARRVLELVRQHRSDSTDYSEMAVLYRTNSQSRAFEEQLRKNSIPYRIVGGQRFYDRKEIKDSIAYLNLIVNPHADISLGRVINFPPRGIGNTSLDRLSAFSMIEGVSLFDALSSADEIPRLPVARLREFEQMIKRWQILQHNGIELGELARTVFEESGMLDFYRNDRSIEAESRLANIEELQSSMARYQAESKEATLADFLQDISLYTSEEGPVEEGQSSVTLMTLHNAKGLEFSLVCMTGLEEDIFPHFLSNGSSNEIEEERRLCYVGMTRAKDNLYMFSATTRFLHGQKKAMGASRFLDEIDANYIESSRPAFNQSSPYSPFVKKRPAGGRHLADDGWGSLDNAWQESAGEANQDPDAVTAGHNGEYRQGMRVRHSHFGSGLILSVTGKAPNQKAVIQFNDGKVKQFALKITPLTLE